MSLPPPDVTLAHRKRSKTIPCCSAHLEGSTRASPNLKSTNQSTGKLIQVPSVIVVPYSTLHQNTVFPLLAPVSISQ